MEFLELANKRYPTKGFKNIPVEDEKIMRILEAGTLSPSPISTHSIHFVIIKDKASLKNIYSTYSSDCIHTAPVIILVCDDEKNVLKQKDDIIYEPIDVAIAINHMTLTATELGLGTYCVSTFDKVKIAELLQIPKGIIPLFLLPIGYSDDNSDLSKRDIRKPMPYILHFNKF